MAKKEKFVWCIAYIDPNYINKAYDDLQKYSEFKNVKVYIPTVKMLRKQFKNEKKFKEVPLLFNYGFFKLPRVKAINPIFLSKLRERISCVRGWVKDISKVWDNPATDVADSKEERNFTSPVATIDDIELSRLVEAEANLSIHSGQDVKNIKEGQIVILRGYPFEGMEAKIESVDHSKKEVEVSLSVEGIFKNTMVDFDNIFYTVYQNPEESNEGNLSLEEIQENNQNKLDKIIADKKDF